MRASALGMFASSSQATPEPGPSKIERNPLARGQPHRRPATKNKT